MTERVTITVSEMAASTGLSRTFLFAELKAGRLNSLKIGKHRLIRTADVAAYLDYYDNLGKAATCRRGKPPSCHVTHFP